MSYRTIIYQAAAGVASITLNRPGAKNAINTRMAQEIADACSQISQNQEIRVVTITGAGEAFSVGTDRNDAPDFGSTGETPRHWLEVAAAVSRLECPVIAAINGDALGQGLELALAADIRIAAETARLGLPHITHGLIPGDGGTQRLPRLVGRAKALEMILTGEPVSAREACRLGLVNKVVPPAELSLVISDMAQRIAASAPLAVKYAKEAVRQGLELTLEQGLHLEADLYLLLQTTKDRSEGITAFLKKRQPKFTGK